jgi:hypothetical protein
MTFYVRTGKADLNKAFKEVFISKGYTYSSSFPVDIVFLSGEAAYYRNRVDLNKSGFVNAIRRPDITYKNILYRKFAGLDFIPYSQDYPAVLPKHFLKILKPIPGYSGEGIRVVETPEQVQQWVEKNKYDSWVIQDYIKTPALKNGYKFHLRVHVLVVGDAVYMCRDIQYFMAKQPYQQGDWENSDIHNTHDNPYFDYMFPQDLPDGWESASTSGIQRIIKTVFSGIKLKADWNGKKPYYIFGLDVLFDKKKPMLLEVNDRVGLVEKETRALIPGTIDILSGTIPETFTQII